MLQALNAVSWIQYALDGVVLLLILIFAAKAAKNGFVKCFFKFISTIIAIIVAFLFMNAVIEWTNGLFGLQDIIKEGCINGLSNIVGFDADVSATGIEEALKGKIPDFLIPMIVDSVANKDIPAGTTVAMIAGDALGGVASGFIAWLAVFIVAKIILSLLEKIFSSLVDAIPLVGALNALLGFAVGAVEGLIVVSGIIAVLAFLPFEGLIAFFDECIIVGWLYHNNFINIILGWLTVA
jgi:uncharacterized membrane protein required for colicin V production